MAISAASGLPGSAVPGGGLTKCDSGSATPQNINPIPIPALNIIAIQETVRNSGFSPSAPSGILPYLLAASQITYTTKTVAISTNNQPVLLITQVCAFPAAVAKLVRSMMPHATNARDPIAVTPKTRRSSPGFAGDLPATRCTVASVSREFLSAPIDIESESFQIANDRWWAVVLFPQQPYSVSVTP